MNTSSKETKYKMAPIPKIKMDIIHWLCLFVGAIGMRAIVSLHPYSGYAKPPMYGDFEAQRHWQEITVNLPIDSWYTNSSNNDLMYWGLDYPPLTAYHSWLLGQIANYINPAYVELHTSRGITDENHKLFMRGTVLLVDIFLYIPVFALAIYTICKYFRSSNEIRAQELLCFYVALFYPGQIAIDNGHFQYNNVSLGLTVLAITCIFKDANKIGAFFFVLALNYKQMELYHALPFFCYLFAKCIAPISTNENKTKSSNFTARLLKSAWLFGTLGAIVLITFGVIWLPWLNALPQVKQVVHRIFPVARGVFEDKVANVWCLLNVFVKLK